VGKDVIQGFITAIENRVAALGTEAEKLLQGGESEFAKFKMAMAAEYAKLAAEFRKVLADL
jgi:hypothetical protein